MKTNRELKESIVKLLQEPLQLNQISTALSLDQDTIYSVLRQLVRDGRVEIDSYNNYSVYNPLKRLRGN